MDKSGNPLPSCPICNADIGPSQDFPWHLEDEDCRAVRKPIVPNDYRLTGKLREWTT